jgi:HK97 family phage major capsid protein
MTIPAPTALVPGVVQPPWPGVFPPDIQARILSVITDGAPFSRACTRLPTARNAVAFAILDSADPSWSSELDLIPDLAPTQSAYEVAVARLNGTLLISKESIADTSFPVTAQTELAIQERFSAKLDRDLISGAGPAPIPTGILPVASASDGSDLLLAAVKGKADIGQNGGTATHIAMSPHFVGELESIKDTIGAQLYPDAATTFAGLTTVVTVAATQPFVFDQSRCWLVVRNDFLAETSDQTDAAWSRFAVSLRIVGRFALAVPQPLKAVRKLTVAGTAPTGSEPVTAGRPAASPRSGKAA